MEPEWITKFEAANSGKYNKIAKNHKGFKPWIEQGYITTKEAPGKTRMATFFKKSNLDDLLQLINSLEKNYLPDKEVVKMLGFEGEKPLAGVKRRKEIVDGTIALCESARIEYKYFENGFKQVYLYVNKKQFLYFLETHIRHVDVYDKYNISYQKIYDLEKKHNIQRVTITKYNYFYRLEDADKYFTIPKYNEEDFYNLDETLSIIGCSKRTMDSIRKEEKLESVYFENKIFYNKQGIEDLLEKMKEIKNKYCTRKNIMKTCNLTYIPEQLCSFPANTLAKQALVEPIAVMYLLEDVYEYKEQIEERTKVAQVLNLSDPVEAFEQILNIREISFSKNSPYTEKEWYSYCKEKLVLTKSSKTTLKSLISSLVDCTASLSELTLEKELYSRTSNEINLNLFNHSVGIHKQTSLYSFLLEYHGKLNVILLEKKDKTKTFKHVQNHQSLSI